MFEVTLNIGLLVYAFKTLSLLVIFITLYFKWSHTYWKRKNVPDLKPKFLLGNIKNIYPKRPGYKILADFYHEMKSMGHKHGGFYAFSTPVYVPIDPGYVKNILLKDFEHFNGRGHYSNARDDPISANIISTDGEDWKKLRAQMNSAFTPSKMKMIFQTVLDGAQPLRQEIERLSDSNEPINITQLAANYTVDVVGSCFFGLECNSFKNPDSELQKHVVHITEDAIGKMKMFLFYCLPKLAYVLRIKVVPHGTSIFFTNIVRRTVEYREKSNCKRNDLMQILIDMRNYGKPLSVTEITSQVYILLVAGYETSSLTMAMCLFELAKHSVIQNKARNEILMILKKYGGKINYDGVSEMKYLDQIISETLRMYPPSPILLRRCNKTYYIPDSNAVLEKGTLVMIPILASQNDPENFPEPQKFDPDRFSNETKENISSFTYLPFGDGPRMCIAMRLAHLELKIGIIMFLKDFIIHPDSRMQQEITLDTNSWILKSKHPIYLKAVRIHA